MVNEEYIWTEFYQEFATKLLEYKENRSALIEKLKTTWDNLPDEMPKFEEGEMVDVDPFSIFGSFNRGLPENKVKDILISLKTVFSLNSEVPELITGSPSMPRFRYLFYSFKEERGEKDIDNLWEIFVNAIKYADDTNELTRQNFVRSYNKIIEQKQIKWNITFGLFWIRPYFYINLDGRSRWFLIYKNGIDDEEIVNEIEVLDLKNDVPNAEQYLYLRDRIVQKLEGNSIDFKTLPELSYKSYVESKKDDEIEKQHPCWIYSPGPNAKYWDSFYEKGIMAIGWSYVGNLDNYSKEDKDKLIDIVADNENLKKKDSKGANQLLLFSKEMKIGDWVFAKDGNSKIVGFGVVISKYYYDESEDSGYFHCRKVKWLKKCNYSLKYSFKGQFTIKKLEKRMRNQCIYHTDIKPIDLAINYEITPIDVKAIYINKPTSGGNIVDPTLKKNLIYFGAPGTGKSHNLNEKAKEFGENIERVTFHENYSYANFVGTYKPKPTSDGKITYKYVPGPFMNILTKALNSKNNSYLLIIEEINRANPAAVFGDVFQLLDRDEEGKSKFPISASEDMQEYLEEVLTDGNVLGDKYDKIFIPENLYIWATMNSADQGVFPMDTAFKRRWDFEYIGIDKGEDIIKNITVELGGKTFKWNDLRKKINAKLTHEYHINEDKCLGPFFAFHEKKYIETGVVSKEDFIDIFKNKIIMYLFEDAARSKRNDLFKNVKGENDGITLSDIYRKFEDDKMYLNIFPDDIIEGVIKDDDEKED